MTWYGLSVFSLVYVLAVAAPGPGVAAIIARSLGHGASRARRLFSKPQSVRWVQRGTGVAMASAAVAVATR